jgi:light-regulated signal transduction histidine kinase (bacteriophytochrome)
VSTSDHLFQWTKLDSVLDQLLSEWEPIICKTKAKITRDALPTAFVDSRQIGQLYGHLLSNAIKFRGRRRPIIHFGAEQQNGHWVLSVRDNGIGIDGRYADSIFEIFKRLHNKQEYSGTGIGLAICKKIMERHGGRIWLESEPSQGSSFYFQLPVHSENRKANSSHPSG